MRRFYSGKNINSFKNALSKANGDKVLCCSDAISAYNVFFDQFSDIFNTNFPLQVSHKIKKKIIKPWMSAGLCNSVKQRSKLYKRYLQGLITKPTYTKYRTSLTNLIKIAKNRYYQNYFKKTRKLVLLFGN
jgi:hypothetical protein